MPVRRKRGSVRNSFLKGVFEPKNTKKYLGKKKICHYRSSWEKTLMHNFDVNPNIKGWCSECVVIPYSFNGKNRRYYIDFLVITEDDRTIIVEVKPFRQTKPPRKSKKKSPQTILYEHEEYNKNLAKWKAAKTYARKRGWEFKILTEKDFRL